jgi:hypothetical protein
VHEIGAEFRRMPAFVPYRVVVEFEIAILPKCEQCGIAHGGELPTEGDLLISHVEQVRRQAFQSRHCRERISRIGTGLAAGHCEEA